MELPLDGCAAARFDEVPIFRDYLNVMAGAEDPEYWRKMRMPVDYDRVHVPALYDTGWLYAAVDTPDTDYACRLLDIAPNGRQTELLSGLIRARHQNRRFEPRLIEPGAFIEYRWDVGNAANTFLPGHRVGLQVMGQLYPYCDRNLNTGESTAHGTRMRAACHRILTGGAEGSWIELPVTDAEEG